MVVEDIAGQIEGSEAIFAIDYRGISVPQAAELRSRLRESDASFRVVKNRLTKLAADKAGREELKDLLEGPTALTFVQGDAALAAKAIATFDREHEVLTFKGGFMEGMTLDEDSFKSIARLPGRDVLHGQLAGVVASPVTGLVRGLNALIAGLATQLGQIADQGLVSGEPPAEEAPAEEAASAEPPADAEPGDAPAEEPASEEEPAGEETPAEEPPTESSAEAETPAEGDPSPPEGEDAPQDDEAEAENSDDSSNDQTDEEE